MFLQILVVLIGQVSVPPAAQMTAEENRVLRIAIRAIEADNLKADSSAVYRELAKLQQLGPKASPAVPALIKMFERANAGEGVTGESNDVVARAAQAAVGELDGGGERSKSKGDYQKALLAAELLGSIGPAAGEAYPTLVKCLEAKTTLTSYKDEITGRSKALRGQVAVPLARIAPRSEELALKFNDKLVKHTGSDQELEEVLRALAIMGTASKPALAGMIACIERKREKKCQLNDGYAITALSAVGAEAVPPLIEQFTKSVSDYRLLKAFGEIGPGAAPAVPLLVESLLDTNRFVREESARSLGKIGVKSEEVLSGLRDTLNDSESGVKTAAAQALKGLQDPKRPAAGARN